METATIFASYGVTAQEYETVWGIAPDADAKDADRVTVALPDDYDFCENVFGETLVEDADGNLSLLSESLAKTGDEPFLRFPVGGTLKKVPLIVVAREGN